MKISLRMPLGLSLNAELGAGVAAPAARIELDYSYSGRFHYFRILTGHALASMPGKGT